jgi:hypothetical protein
MIIKEYRVTLPMTVEEYQVAQLYAVAEASKNETGGGEGVEVQKNEPYDNVPLLNGKFCKGQYTYKIYHLASKVPGWIKMIAPAGALEIHEEAWNAYPYCKTVLSNPGYMKDNFYIVIETYHVADEGKSENVHELDKKKLKERTVVPIDIANDPVNAADFKKDEDPSSFVSEKTGRGPLKADWIASADPVMTCYKLVTIQFKWWGLQNKVETFIHSTQKRLFTNFHRQVFCWLDKWYGMSMADIRALEEETKKKLDEERAKGEIRGTTAIEK